MSERSGSLAVSVDGGGARRIRQGLDQMAHRLFKLAMKDVSTKAQQLTVIRSFRMIAPRVMMFERLPRPAPCACCGELTWAWHLLSKRPEHLLCSSEPSRHGR